MTRTIHDLVQHIEWRADGDSMTKEKFTEWAGDYLKHGPGLTDFDVETAWNMFTLGRLR